MSELHDSLWGHIADLRKTLIRTAWIFAIGFVTLLSFYEPIIHSLTSLSLEHLQSGLNKQKVERFEVKNWSAITQIFHLPADSSVVSLKGSAQGKQQYRLAPGDYLVYEQSVRPRLLILGPIEGLVLVFKACFWLSIAATAPIWSWIWLQFILPGMKRNERIFLIPFLFLSLFFMLCGCFLAYFLTLPLANEYLALFNSSIGQNAWTLNHYINYVLFLCVGHAIAAELALILIALVHFRLLSPELLISKRRYMIVAAFILGALLTPPDVLTQLLLAFPLMGIYEIAILYGKWRNRLANSKEISPILP